LSHDPGAPPSVASLSPLPIDSAAVDLADFGWNDDLAAALDARHDPGLRAGRVIVERRGRYLLATADGEIPAVSSGRLRHRAAGRHELPVIGDWVAFRPVRRQEPAARIHALLPRRTRLSRKVAGARTQEQLLAANVDTVLLVMALDGDYNPRRLERLIAMTRESGAAPAVVLTKRDLAAEPEVARDELEQAFPGVPILTVSAPRDEGLDELRALLAPRETFVLVGSSGAGKSTLLNHLYGEEVMSTGEVRARDERGQHTTSHRQLVRLPGGPLLIDSPGIREVQLWSSPESLDETFEEIGELAAGCRFRNCTHRAEPGCNVLSAVERGELDAARLEHFRALGEEVEALARRQDQQQRREDQKRLAARIRAAKKRKAER
jgi:ribosome biogenesis GTPase